MLRRVLLVEDSDDDVELTRVALRNTGTRIELDVARDGEEALQTLMSRRPRPDLILLDLNMPRMDGREFLARLKGHPEWGTVPVIVLTTSSSPDDIEACYAGGANCYVTKPVDFNDFRQALTTLFAFWFGIARLPRPT